MQDAEMGSPNNLIQIEGAENVRISPTMGVAMIALNMALKYCDINTVQDGTLYQQYKLEGRNMNNLHLDHVFDVAKQIEVHLLSSSREIAEMMVNGVMGALSDLAEEGDTSEQGAPDLQSQNLAEASAERSEASTSSPPVQEEGR